MKKLKGYFYKITTGKCKLYLYYNGCGCYDCMSKQILEMKEFKKQ